VNAQKIQLHITLVFLLFIVSLPSRGQDVLLHQKVSFQFKAITIEQFLDSISVSLNAGISYDAGALPIDSVISLSANNIEVRELLYGVLGKERIEVSSMPGQIVISRATHIETVKQSEFIKLTGLVTDLSDSTPLAAVNICVVNEPLGTITNENGQFEFIIPKNLAGQTIAFSMMGYIRESIMVPRTDSVANIMMASTNIKLPEVKVMALSPDWVIKNIIAKRNNNYLLSTVALTGFFRESIIQDGEFVQVSEAMIEIYKPPYDEQFNLERVRFIKGRRNNSVDQMNFVQFRLQGGPFYFSRLDVAHYLDFLPNVSEPNIYKYKYLGGDELWGRRMIKIGFEPIDDNGELKYEGELIVDIETFAIASVDFWMTRNTLKESRKYLIRKESRQFKAKPYMAKYHIDYRPFNDKWILNSVKGEMKVKVVVKKSSINSDFQAVTEMLITDMRPVDGNLPKYNETFKPNYILSDQIKGLDEDFWGNYNVIQPGDELKNIFKTKKP
jgi:hypothetical protein